MLDAEKLRWKKIFVRFYNVEIATVYQKHDVYLFFCATSGWIANKSQIKSPGESVLRTAFFSLKSLLCLVNFATKFVRADEYKEHRGGGFLW